MATAPRTRYSEMGGIVPGGNESVYGRRLSSTVIVLRSVWCLGEEELKTPAKAANTWAAVSRIRLSRREIL